MNNNDIIDDLTITLKRLMVLEPYYGMFCLGLNKVIHESVITAGVCKKNINIELAVAPNFWKELSKDYKIGVIKHELLHIAFNHLTMRSSYSDYELFNIAADLEINQYINKEFLPDFALKLSDFKLESFPKMGTKFYYDKLKDQLKDPNSNLSKLYKLMKDGEKIICSHESWKEFDQLSDVEKKVIEKQVHYQMKNVAEELKKQQGLLPAELSDFIEALFKLVPPTVDWKVLIRRFIGGSKEIYTKKTRRKKSKRIPMNPGLKIKQKPKGIFYWDQSGSVSEEEHKLAFSEVKHIWKSGLNFDIAPFNTIVFKPYKYKGENKYQQSGGGTSFTPITEHFNKNSFNYSFGIILTDGYAEIPPKFNKPILWLITPDGKSLDEMKEYPGVKIKMKNKIEN